MENWIDLLKTLLQVVIITIVPIISAYIINYLKAKATGLKLSTDNALLYSSIEMVEEIVTNAVAFVSQTYVDNLKKDGKFDIEEQKQAFNMAYDRIMQLVDQEQQEFLDVMFGNFSDWVGTLIEAAVRRQK